jgi:hypothetical protein
MVKIEARKAFEAIWMASVKAVSETTTTRIKPE